MDNNFNASVLDNDSLLLLLNTARGAALRTTITELAHRGHLFEDWEATCDYGDGAFGLISERINGTWVVYAASPQCDTWARSRGKSTKRVLPVDVQERLFQN